MAIFNKQKIGTANAFHSKLDVSGTHITTQNFMEFEPIFYRHMLPGEHLKGSISALSRLAPVAVPTYGRCRLNLRSFFVPFSFVSPNFNEMLTDVVANNYESSSLVAESPKLKIESLIEMFLTYQVFSTYPLSEQVTNANDAFDFVVSSQKYRFTTWGKRFYKLLLSLGYQLVLAEGKDSFYVSALPLLCMAKVYVDWYSNQAYQDRADLLAIKRLFKFNDPLNTLELTTADIAAILLFVSYVQYDGGNTVYINAWDNPVSPNSGNFSAVTANDQFSDVTIGSSPGSVITANNGTPYMKQNNSTNTNIGSEYLHEMLKSLTDYFKRNQLSGAVSVSRFLAQYGINLDSKAIGRSYYISSSSYDIDFGSVMQTADTSSSGEASNLGDYAGVGFGKGSLDVDFKCDEFGLFIVVSSIVPAADFVQGLDANLFHIGKFDFYNGAFDSLGCSAIRKGEVYCSRSDSFASLYGDYLGVFGFAPRYYEYKQGRSMVSGDFAVESAMIGGDAWHLNRMFVDTNFLSQISGLTHSNNFTSGLDANQYDRIFQYTSSDVDKFYVVYHAALQANSPCKSLFDTYDFTDVGKVIELNGNSANVN